MIHNNFLEIIFPEIHPYPIETPHEFDSPQTCKSLMSFLKSSMHIYSKLWKELFQGSKSKEKEIQAIQRALKMQDYRIIWLPEYACAIVVLISENGFMRSPYVVYTEQWTTKVRFGENTKNVACALNYGKSFCSLVENSEFAEINFDGFEELFHHILNLEIGLRKKDIFRVPKTPAFIHEVMNETLGKVLDFDESGDGKEINKNIKIKPIVSREGMSDIGKTDSERNEGTARHTAWPIILSVLQYFIEKNNEDIASPDLLIKKFKILVELDYCENLPKDQHFQECQENPEKLAFLSQNLPKIFVENILQENLNELQINLDYLSKKIAINKKNIEKLANIGQFKNFEKDEIIFKNFEKPIYNLNKIEELNIKVGIDLKEEREKWNVFNPSEWRRIPSKPTYSILSWIYQMEKTFWNAAKTFLEENKTLLKEDNVINLLRMTKDFNQETKNIIEREASKCKERWILIVERRSHNLLVVFICACITYKYVSEQHPSEMRKFKIPYDDKLLRKSFTTLSLQAYETSLIVRNYLKKMRKKKLILFDLTVKNFSDTITFADKYPKNKDMISYHAADCEWTESQKTQRKSDIENHIKLIEAEYRKLHELQEKMRQNNEKKSENWEVYYNKNNKIQKDINQQKSRIAELENKKFPAIHPHLPRDKQQAYIILFFLFLPSEFSHLAHSISSIEKCFKGNDYTDYKIFYKYLWLSGRKAYKGPSFPSFEQIAYSSNDFNSNRKIHYLDDLEKHIIYPNSDIYLDRDGQIIELTDSLMTLYTEKTINDKEGVNSWMIAHPEKPKPKAKDSRGNFVYAKLNERAFDITPQVFIQLGSLRSYPHLQILKLSAMLCDSKVPLEKRSVRHLIFQTFGHSISSKKLFEHDIGILFDALQYILKKTPAMYASRIPIYGILASFVGSQKLPDFSYECAKQLLYIRNIAIQEINSMDKDLLARCCYICGLSLICFRNKKQITKEDVETFVEALILYRVDSHYIPSSAWESKKLGLDYLIQLSILDIVESVNSLVPQMPDILTKMVELIFGYKTQLQWKNLEGYWWYALSKEDNQQYHISLLNGKILCNGSERRRLPSSITNYPDYKELFIEGTTFEVINKAENVYRTTQEYCKKIFEFHLNGNIEMEDLQSGIKLHLLPKEPFKYIGLFETHECRQWVEVNTQIIFFTTTRIRPNEPFRVRFISLGKKDNDLNVYCKVPKQFQEFSLNQIVEKAQKFDILGKISSKRILSFFRRVESEEHMHILRDHNGRIMIDLPRLFLKFYIGDDDLLHSLDYEKYVLSEDQSVFPHIEKSLILQLAKEEIDNPSKSLEIFLLLSPKKITLYNYEFHRRFGYLESTTREGRLFLASQLAKYETDSILPRFGMSAVDIVIILLRQCFTNSPLNNFEEECLQEVIKSSYKEPIMALIGYAIYKFQEIVDFLPFQEKEDKKKRKKMSPILFQDAWNVYKSQAKYGYISPRRVLKPIEIFLIFSDNENSICKNATLNSFKFLPKIDEWQNDFSIKKIERELIKSFTEEFLASTQDIEINDITKNSKTKLAEEINLELIDSWKKYKNNEQHKLKENCIPNLKTYCVTKLEKINEIHKKINDFFTNFENEILKCPYQNLHETANHRINSLALDRLEFMNSIESVRMFYKLPFEESKDICIKIQNISIYYGTICVLEDKLNRILYSCKRAEENKSNNHFWEQNILNNIFSKRVWDPKDHPYWLVYEVEQRLQIRPSQHKIATFLIEKSNKSTQLNMGLGKTRVIIPMIIMYFIYREKPTPFVKVHTLTPILGETARHLSKTLTASSLNIFQCEIPFHRDVDMNCREISKMEYFLNIIRKYRLAFIVLAREHTQSLILKGVAKGLQEKPELETKIQKLLKLEPSVDIIDESDAFLRHSIKLIYAIGSPQLLVDGETRWWTAHRLLTALDRLVKKNEISSDIISFSNTTDKQAIVEISNQNLDDKEKMLILRKKILFESLNDGPREMTNYTIDLIKKDNEKSEIVNFLVTEESDYGSVLEKHWPMNDIKFLLALRGFLSRGILEHCLARRHRVNYGVCTTRIPPRRVAIPFDAAEEPNLRSEFALPDVTIVFTLLSYFYSGLAREDFDICLKVLRNQGPSVQTYFYNRWVNKRLSVQSALKQLPFDALNVDALDLSNKALTDELYHQLQFDTETIGFFLALEVFPNETQQYNDSISSTAWDCVDCPHPMGLSGTNDTHRLLPLPLKHQNADEEIAGTNGMMLSCIILRTKELLSVRNHVEELEEKNKLIGWQIVVEDSLQHQCEVIIDAGALLVGAPIQEICDFIVNNSQHKFFAILYFSKNEWFIYDSNTSAHMPKSKSSIHEGKEGVFIIFDQAHCRGADLKLHPNVKGLLTISSGMTKDVFMQAAGRLRQLHVSQSLVIFSFREVEQEILKTKKILNINDNNMQLSVKDVLLWTLFNTVRVNEQGLTTWSDQGLHHSLIKGSMNTMHRMMSQNSSLEIYRPKIDFIEFSNKFQDLKKFYFNFLSKENEKVKFDKETNFLWNSLKYFALDIRILSSETSLHSCEREIERQEEKNDEKEMEHKKLSPCLEISLEFEEILSSRNKKMTLSEVFQCSGIKINFNLPKNNAIATENFYNTVIQNHIANKDIFFPYSRAVQFLWKENNKQIILLSDLEANNIYKAILKKNSDHFKLRSSFVLWYPECNVIDENIRTQVKLYSGEVKFDEKEKPELSIALEDCNLSLATQCIDLRFLRHTILCSDYEAAVREEEAKREKKRLE